MKRIAPLIACALVIAPGCYTVSGTAEHNAPPQDAASQEAKSRFETSVIARITAADAPVYAEPDRTSGITRRLEGGEVVIAYQEGRGFVAIATAAHEPIGYVERANISIEGAAWRQEASGTGRATRMAFGVAPSLMVSRNSETDFLGFGGKIAGYDRQRGFGLLLDVSYTTKDESVSLATADYSRLDLLLGATLGVGGDSESGYWYAAPKAGLVRTGLEGRAGFISVSDHKYGPVLGVSIGMLGRPLLFDVGVVYIPSQRMSIAGTSTETGWMVAGTVSLGLGF